MICDCMEKKRRELEALEAQKEREREIKLLANSISVKYRGLFRDSDDKKNVEVSNKVNSYIVKFAEFSRKNIGLMFYGETGSGKTFYASIIANELCKAGKKVMMINEQDAVMKIRDFNYSQDFIKQLIDVDLFILDDFGSIYQSESNKSKVLEVIDTRYNSGKPMILTTNIDRKFMNERCKDRIYSRIIEATYPILVVGDRRVDLAKLRRKEIEDMFSMEE